MAIDWFTVVAQILNFLILVWLLKRFLYQPILDAIDAREQRIADELNSADTKQREAQKECDEFVQKNAEFEQQKQTLMQEAKHAADTERTRLIAAAREQADALEAKRRKALKREQLNLQTQLRSLIRDEVFAIARKALADLADTSLEKSITETFIGRLQAMESDAKQAFVNALADNSSSSDNTEHVLVCSAFDLPPQQKASIQNAINTKFSADIPLQFETAANVISGIRLSVKGQQISWNIDEYLALLEKNVGGLLKSVSDTNSSAPKPAVSNKKESDADTEALVPETAPADTAEVIPTKTKSAAAPQ